MEVQREKKVYPLDAEAYRLLEEIGQGVSATVYRAICVPCNEVVAVKSLDLEKCTSNLDEIRREAQTMSLICHPNVVKAYCSFVVDHSLWVVMPYLAGGSCLHVMKASYPDGFEEPVIATVLKESLKALDYLHRHGLIHRDVKAGNILVDGNGTVKLGDFGVSACMFDTGDRQRSRNTFVGTPCWMAPEVMEQVHGYDFKADIWSFGITALELAHGHAPFSKYPPMKVLLMTLQNAPPGLDYERDKRFSKSFKEMIAMCLVKDPGRRPSAEKLLKHSFFRNARSYEYVARHLLDGLPALGARVKNLKLKDATRLAQKKMPYGEQQERSQNEYKRGVSCWNFNVEDLKAEAALIHDDAFAVVSREETEYDFHPPKEFAVTQITSPKQAASDPLNLKVRVTNHCLEAEASLDACEPLKRKGAGSAVLHRRGRFDLVEDDVNTGGSTRPEDAREPCLSRGVTKGQPRTDVDEMYMLDDRVEGAGKEHRRIDVEEVDSDRLDRSALCLGGQKINKDSEKEHCQLRCAVEDLVCCNVVGSDGTLGGHPASTTASLVTADQVLFVDGKLPASRSSTSLKDGVEEKSKEPLVQRKGRFSVTSEIVDQLENAFLRKSASVGDWSYDRKHDAPTLSSTSSQSPAESVDAFIPTAAIVPHLRNILQQATIQEDLLVNLICSINSPDTSNGRRLASVGSNSYTRAMIKGNGDSGVELMRDRDLCQQVAEQRSRIAYLVDELEGLKLRNIRLERQVLLASRSFMGSKDGIEEKSEGLSVQRKGRFSVTSEDGKQVDDTLFQTSPGVGDGLPERRHTSLLQSTFSQLPVSNWINAMPTGAILPRLQNILHQATIQQDLLLNLILSIKTCNNSNPESPSSLGLKRFSRTVSGGRSESSVDLTSDKDRDLHHLVFELQGRIADLYDDLKVTKLTNIQLEHQWNSMSSKEEERIHRMET